MLENSIGPRPPNSSERRDRLLYLGIVLSALLIFIRWVLYITRGELVPPYKLTLFWVDYRDGFVRRGLPGQLMSTLADHQPTIETTTILGVALSALAAVAVYRLASALAGHGDRLAIVALFAISPLALPLMLRDLGRYDAIVVAALVGAAATLARYRTVIAAPCAATLFAIATASEEFAVAFAIPVAATAMRLLYPDRRCFSAALTAAVLTPAVIVALASILIAPPTPALEARSRAARAAGVKASQLTADDAASMLGASASEQAATFARYAPSVLLATALGAAFLSIVTGAFLWRLLGGPDRKPMLVAAIWLILSATALSFAGVDYIRWWSLAFLTLAVVLYLLCQIHDSSNSHPVKQRWIFAVIALSLIAADFPIEPTRIVN